MLHLLQRHPFPVVAHFDFSLVLTYAFPRELLTPLLPPGLELDTHGGLGFVAVAMVQTSHLRPAGLPQALGQSFFLAGYRIFTRFRNRAGRRLRGLKILRSDTDSRLMLRAGNLLTHYGYRLARVACRRESDTLAIGAVTPGGAADIAVAASLEKDPRLPLDSPFADWREARRFAGPLPFTFDYEPQTHSMIVIEGVREHWQPRPVAASVTRLAFFDHPPFQKTTPRLASAFFVENIPYRWRRGIREPLPL